MGANNWRREKWVRNLDRAKWNSFLDFTQRLLKDLGLGPDDERYALNVRNGSRHRLSLVLRDRLVFALSTDGGAHLILMLSPKAPEQNNGVPLVEMKDDLFAGAPAARLYTLPLEVMGSYMERLYPQLLDLCRALLKVTGKKTRYREHHIGDVCRMVFEPDFREKAMDYVLDEKGEWPGEVFGKHYPKNVTNPMKGTQVGPNVVINKLGCIWGTGMPNFYGMIKRHSIIITVPKYPVNPGDLILITNGHTGLAIAQVSAPAVAVSTRPELMSDFTAHQIEYTADVLVADAVWYELPAERRIMYKLQQGIVNVVDPPIRKQVIDNWNSRGGQRGVPDYDPNIILYGPPGTGKTYTSASYAVAIVEGEELDQALDEGDEGDRKALLGRYWGYMDSGRIGFVTFHQSFSYEDFIEGIKPVLGDGRSDGQVEYELRDGLFKAMSNAAMDNWLAASNTTSTKPPFDEAFERFVERWEENPAITIPMKTQDAAYTIMGFTSASIKFRKASGGEQHTLSKNTLREIYYGRKEAKQSGVGIYYPGLLVRLKEFTPDRQERTELQRYVLVIDEINRGNVSGIFGELITLLEKDKRLGGDESIRLRLPYSKELFAVPPNLYILGTLNTADRSVEALDTALRRRFSFVEMQAKVDKIEPAEGLDVDLRKLLTAINARLERLLDKDHHIGHSYFMSIEVAEDPERELRRVFKNKVLPLLEEYFYGDPRKVGAVLGKAWVKPRPKGGPELIKGFGLDDAAKEVFDVADPMKVLLEDFRSIYV